MLASLGCAPQHHRNLVEGCRPGIAVFTWRQEVQKFKVTLGFTVSCWGTQASLRHVRSCFSKLEGRTLELRVVQRGATGGQHALSASLEVCMGGGGKYLCGTMLFPVSGTSLATRLSQNGPLCPCAAIGLE